MAVAGENHIPIDISKGLFVSPTPDYIPDGYLRKSVNMVKTKRGSWALRKGFKNIHNIQESALNLGTAVGQHIAIPEDPNYLTVGFDFILGYERRPQVMLGYTLTGGGGPSRIANMTGEMGFGDTTDVVVQATGGILWNTACQYKDRVYVSSLNTINRVSGFIYDGTTPALTITSMGTPATGFFRTTQDSSVLCTYGDRVFHALGNRLSWTDIPAPGGFPETWTVGNFLDLSPDNTGSPAIKNMFHLNGILYIFTNKGVYALNGKGSTSTWVIDFVTDAIKISNKGGVALIHGAFICTDKNKLFVFDGARIKEFGTEIQFLFEIYNSFTISPFEDGFILSARYYTISAATWVLATPVGATAGIWPKNKCYYFDGNFWSEFSMTANNKAVDIIGGAVGKKKWKDLKENISLVVYHDIDNACYGIASYSKTNMFDTFFISGSSANQGISGELQTKDIVPGVGSTYCKIKKWYTKIFSLIDNVTGATYKNGSSAAVYSTPQVVTSLADNNYIRQFSGPEISTRVSFGLSVSCDNVPTVFNTDFPDYVPVFEIKEIIAVGDINVRDDTEVSQT